MLKRSIVHVWKLKFSPPHQHPGTSGINSIPMTLRQLREAQRPIVPTSVRPTKRRCTLQGMRKTYPTQTGSWVEIIIDSKKPWDFFWDGRYVSLGGGWKPCFSVELHQSPTTGWFQPKKTFVRKALTCVESSWKDFWGWFSQTKKTAEKNSSRRCQKSTLLAVG